MSVIDSAKATTTRRNGAPPTLPPNSYRDSTLAIFALLLAFRIVNALTLRTFFQPDEFFQSLEPAWQLAFGDTTDAWITWVNAPPNCLHVFSTAVSLTMRAGVENATALVPASSPFCRSLSICGTTRRLLWLDPAS